MKGSLPYSTSASTALAKNSPRYELVTMTILSAYCCYYGDDNAFSKPLSCEVGFAVASLLASGFRLSRFLLVVAVESKSSTYSCFSPKP